MVLLNFKIEQTVIEKEEEKYNMLFPITMKNLQEYMLTLKAPAKKFT